MLLNRIILLLYLPLILSIQDSSAQAVEKVQGMPRIIHYTKKDFNSDPQFWTMCQDNQGIYYFGNNEGVLIFDGERWQKVKLPNSSSVRTLKLSSSGQVYAGGYNELGLVIRDEKGQYGYKSLVELLRPEDRNLENIWQIHEAEGYLIFRSAKKLIALANDKAITIPTTGTFWYCNVVNNKLYVHDHEGIKHLDLKSMEFSEIIKNESYNVEPLLALLGSSDENELLLFTKPGKLYKIDKKNHSTTFLKQLLTPGSNNLLLSAMKATDSQYYIGTLSSQVIVLEPKDLEVLSNQTFKDLQDNTVLNLFEDTKGNIWTLLNNGVDCIDVGAPITTLFDQAAVFDVLRVGTTFYVATNQGVMKSTSAALDFSSSSFTKINGLEGQAWKLHHINNRILCSHDRGLFEISGNKVIRIGDITGIWKVIPINGRPDLFFACNYESIFLLEADANGFRVKQKVEGFNESSRDILQTDEPGVFWICHGYKGVFRIKLNEGYTRVVSLEHFKGDHGLPSPFNINVFRWKKDIVFTTNAGIYTFDSGSTKFILHDSLTNLFGKDKNVRKLLQHQDKTWFVHDDEVGYFLTDAPQPTLEKGLFLGLKGSFNQGMECLIPQPNNQILLGTIDGLYAFDLSYKPTSTPEKLLLTRVSAHHTDGQVMGSIEFNEKKPLALDYQSANLRFDFAAPGFKDRLHVQYRYRVDPLDNDWSDWQETPYKELSYLHAGKHTLHAQARSLLGEVSNEVIYTFHVLPAWYQTRIAYAIYFIAFMLASVAGWRIVKNKIERERLKTQEEEAKKRKVLELEIQQIKLQREKEQIEKDKELLEEDVIHKSKELANYTMLLVRKRELLSEMNETMKSLKEHLRNDTSRQMVRDLTRKINSNLENEEHLQVFEANFERVHHEFFTKLKATFSDLSTKELQLCAFVRMNLTNKEIASILNISVRGVETARYRLRKRLGMSHEQDMSAFLEKLHAPGVGDDSNDAFINN